MGIKRPTKNLLPLGALRAFEAAARHKNFTLAADELRLTPSAVSHQIRVIETFLQTQLFIRSGNRMLLSIKGEQYYDHIKQAFESIETGTELVFGQQTANVLSLRVAPSFGRIWLMPFLVDFITKNPDLELNISTESRPADFERQTFDAEIRYGTGDWPELRTELIAQERITPLCSPALLERGTPLNSPEDIFEYPVIHTDSRIMSWQIWLKRNNVKGRKFKRELRFDRSPHALAAASEGVGIALESLLLARPHLESGRLVAPFELSLINQEAYFLVAPPAHFERPQLELFRRWLHQILSQA